MSFHQLGISRFPVLHRQLTERDVLEENSGQDVAQDSRDVLIERLNDLVARLSSQDNIETEALKNMHSTVDHIEVVLRGREKSPKSPKLPEAPKSPLSPRRLGSSIGAEHQGFKDDVFWGPPTPTRNISMRLPGKSPGKDPYVSPATAIEIARRAEGLAEKLEKYVNELRLRKNEVEESNYMLLQKVKDDTQVLASLKEQHAELQDDYETSQAELNFLRIQLQAIECQTSHITKKNEDSDLTRSINNWKKEWAAQQKNADRKRKRFRNVVDDPDDTGDFLISSIEKHLPQEG